MNNISWMKRWWNQLTCLWWSNGLGIYLYLVAILDSRCGWGIQRGTFPNSKNFYPPPHTISVHGLRHLAFEHLALEDPEPFVHLGPRSFGPFCFPFKMQSDLTVIATGISILLQYLNHTLEPNDIPPISHTVLWPGVNGPFYVWDLLCKPNGVWVWLAPKWGNTLRRSQQDKSAGATMLQHEGWLPVGHKWQASKVLTWFALVRLLSQGRALAGRVPWCKEGLTNQPHWTTS